MCRSSAVVAFVMQFEHRKVLVLNCGEREWLHVFDYCLCNLKVRFSNVAGETTFEICSRTNVEVIVLCVCLQFPNKK